MFSKYGFHKILVLVRTNYVRPDPGLLTQLDTNAYLLIFLLV